MECLLYQIAELGCPNVCYAVDVKDSTLEKAEEQEVSNSVVPNYIVPVTMPVSAMVIFLCIVHI